MPVCAGDRGSQRGHWVSCSWTYRWLWATLWVLGRNWVFWKSSQYALPRSQLSTIVLRRRICMFLLSTACIFKVSWWLFGREALVSFQEWRAISGCERLLVFKNGACVLSDLTEITLPFQQLLWTEGEMQSCFPAFVASRLDLLPLIIRVSCCVYPLFFWHDIFTGYLEIPHHAPHHSRSSPSKSASQIFLKHPSKRKKKSKSPICV